MKWGLDRVPALKLDGIFMSGRVLGILGFEKGVHTCACQWPNKKKVYLVASLEMSTLSTNIESG